MTETGVVLAGWGDFVPLTGCADLTVLVAGAVFAVRDLFCAKRVMDRKDRDNISSSVLCIK